MAFLLIDDKFHANPKIIAAGNPAVGLFVRLLAWSADNLTDGYLPEAVARQYGTKREIDALLFARRTPAGCGLIEETPGGFIIPDYLDFNPSGAAVRERRTELSQARARAGRAGGIASGSTRRAEGKPERSNAEANREAESKRNEAPIPIPIPIPNEQVSTPPPVSTTQAPVVVEPSIKNTIVLATATRLADKEPAGKITSRSAWVHSVAQRLLRDHGDWIDEQLAGQPFADPLPHVTALLARASGADPDADEKQAASGTGYGRSVLQAQVEGDMLDRDSFLREIEDRPQGWRDAAVVAYDASRAALLTETSVEVPSAQIIHFEQRRQQ